MTSIIVILLLVICTILFVLHRDARVRRTNRLVASVMPQATSGPEYRSIRRQQIESRWQYVHRLANYKDGIAYKWPPRYVLFAAFVVALAVCYAGTTLEFDRLYVIPVSFIAALGSVRGLFGFQRRHLATQLFHQLPDTIELVRSTVRAGLPVNEAFQTIADKMPQPTGGQFAMVCDEIKLGRQPEDALDNVYRRTDVAEYGMFAVTLAIQTKSGGGLSETLKTLADTVRERVALAARAKALAAEVIFSARALSVAPFLCGAFMYWLNPSTVDLLFTDPTGKLLLAYGVISVIIGALVMRWMVRKETAI